MVNKENFIRLREQLGNGVTLVAVSKMKTAADILQLYELGQRDFGENYVQELLIKQPVLPRDIRWHFIGHLQSNKVKLIASFIHLVHSVDSFKLFREIHKEGLKQNRVINCLLQIHIAKEETKFGLDAQELVALLKQVQEFEIKTGKLFAKVTGLMGMASLTEDELMLENEFQTLKNLLDIHRPAASAGIDLTYLSMGMSNDYELAIRHGSNMVRIGSLLFGRRG